jgi:hypothetical protein
MTERVKFKQSRLAPSVMLAAFLIQQNETRPELRPSHQFMKSWPGCQANGCRQRVEAFAVSS